MGRGHRPNILFKRLIYIYIYMASFFFFFFSKKLQMAYRTPKNANLTHHVQKKKKTLLCLNKKILNPRHDKYLNINFVVHCCAKILLAIILLWFVRSWSIFAIYLLIITSSDLVKRLWTYNKIINITFIWIVNHEKSNYKFRLYQEKKYK